MKLKKETDYALRIVFFLAKIYIENANEIIDSKSISKAEHIPESFCLKILKKLVKAKIIKVYRGVSGGYSLDKEPCDISLGEVIHVIEKDEAINTCICTPGSCSNQRDGRCPVRNSLSLIQNELFKSMEKIKFSDIINSSF
ncbi:RrF2 family transcriptional regulator [Cetobacterium sp. SF1]|uniref:RrF2 family transcriptional regulator n=1 Tax=Cetobacterium sp. SF1 TaxID=3417654 RepID=UPI003CFA26BF